MKTIIASPKAPKAVGPYSQAVKCGDTLYISGQLPIDGATGAMPESIEDQTRQSLTNLGHILEEAGYSHADIVKTTVLLTDIADFAAMNAVYATFFTKDMPARICYQVSKLPMGAKVEIDAVARRPDPLQSLFAQVNRHRFGQLGPHGAVAAHVRGELVQDEVFGHWSSLSAAGGRVTHAPNDCTAAPRATGER